MSIQYTRDSILKADTNIIAHQVNCMGVIDTDLTEQLAYKYPDSYDKYRDICSAYPRIDILGHTSFTRTPNGTIIANCFAQAKSGYGLQTNYDALKKCLKTLEAVALKHKFSVAIPYRIGCGLAGGNWEVIKQIIEDIYKNSSVELKIYNYES